MKRKVFVISFVAFIIMFTAAVSGVDKPKIVLFPVVTGTDYDLLPEMKEINRSIMTDLTFPESVVVFKSEVVLAKLEKISCQIPKCYKEEAVSLQADYFVTATIENLGKGDVLTMKLYSSKSAEKPIEQNSAKVESFEKIKLSAIECFSNLMQKFEKIITVPDPPKVIQPDKTALTDKNKKVSTGSSSEPSLVPPVFVAQPEKKPIPDEKGRLFFKGTVIFPAVSDSQIGIIKNVDKIIDAELFSARLMPFLKKQDADILKEKSLKCLNIECIISEAEKSGVSAIVTSDISITSNLFKGTIRLYDVGFKTVVAETHVNGFISDIEKNYTNLVKNLIASSYSYLILKNYKKNGNTEEFGTSKFNPIVVLKTEKAAGSPEQFQSETKSLLPEKMNEFHDLSTVKNKDLIDAYEQALRADRFGESDPEKAIAAWTKVTSLAESGVIKYFSIKRGNEWFLYKKDISDKESLKNIIAKERFYQLFPDILVKMWKEYMQTNPGAARYAFAEKRVAFYTGKSSEIKRYTDERTELSGHMKTVYSKNLKVLNLNMVSLDKKIDVLLKFLEFYGAVDGDFYYLRKMISKISNENEKQIASKNIFNKWNAEFFKEKCRKKDFQSCIISEQIFNIVKVFPESTNLQSKGCAAGVLELCASFAKSKLDSADPATEELAKNSCAMGSGKGCFVLANFYEKTPQKKAEASKDVLYEISCERGYMPACPVKKKSIRRNEITLP